MSTITFDTHAFVKRLTASGLSEQQAEAIAEAQKESLGQALDTTLATKSDIQRIEADVMLKGTRVDGIYTADPEKDPNATKFEKISFDEVYQRNLKVMDLTATAMCKENNLPIIVFNMDIKGNLKKVLEGQSIGTYVFR